MAWMSCRVTWGVICIVLVEIMEGVDKQRRYYSVWPIQNGLAGLIGARFGKVSQLGHHHEHNWNTFIFASLLLYMAGCWVLSKTISVRHEQWAIPHLVPVIHTRRFWCQVQEHPSSSRFFAEVKGWMIRYDTSGSIASGLSLISSTLSRSYHDPPSCQHDQPPFIEDDVILF
jgi:hypothetical protein